MACGEKSRVIEAGKDAAKDPEAGKDWRQKKKAGSRGWDGWIASSTQWTWIWINPRKQSMTGSMACCGPWGLNSQTWLSDWTTATLSPLCANAPMRGVAVDDVKGKSESEEFLPSAESGAAYELPCSRMEATTLKEIQEVARLDGRRPHSAFHKVFSSHMIFWGLGDRDVCDGCEFRDWLRNLPKVLVCKGPPGPARTKAGSRC